jgi:hypothetical protein
MSETPPLGLYLVRLRCGGQTISRTVWAASEKDAGRVIRANPSVFGLPHATVLILRAEWLDLRESTIV